MIEIIKAGKKPGDRLVTATCRNCETEFRFKASEAQMSLDPRDGGVFMIKCPTCNLDVWIAASLATGGSPMTTPSEKLAREAAEQIGMPAVMKIAAEPIIAKAILLAEAPLREEIERLTRERDEAYERAAKIADDAAETERKKGRYLAASVAAAIRKLKDQKP